MSSLRDRVGVRGLLAATTGLTGVLIVLGVYTASTGSGLACSQQWPLCDGGVLPQSMPSFIEWLHRFVAMIIGFFIVGSAGAAWRWQGDRRVRYGATAALVLLPFQIVIGGITVTVNGLIPWGYSVPVHAAHLLAALSIFTSLLLATLWASEGDLPTGRTYWAALAALGALLVSVPLGRGVGLPYGIEAQAVYYTVCLVCFAAAVTAAVWAREEGGGSFGAVGGCALAATPLVVVQLVLARDILLFYGWVELAYFTAMAATAAALAAAAWLARDHGHRGRRRATPE
jgi:cytochrome c oxidase assembly protein subunit 15